MQTEGEKASLWKCKLKRHCWSESSGLVLLNVNMVTSWWTGTGVDLGDGFWSPLPFSNTSWCYREVSRLLPGLFWVCGWRNLITRAAIKCCTYMIQGRSACVNSELNIHIFHLGQVWSSSLLDSCHFEFGKKTFFSFSISATNHRILETKSQNGVFSGELSFY